MKILVVAYKFGTEEEMGRHLGTYHYFIEKMRRVSRLGHEVLVLAPYLSFFRRGTAKVDGLKVFRYLPPMIANPKLFFLKPLWRHWYISATQRQVFKLNKAYHPDAIYVWQARETGYALARISDQLFAPLLFRQITAWQWHFQRTPKEIFGIRPWYKLAKILGLQRPLDHFLLSYVLERSLQIQYGKTIYAKAQKIVFLSQAAAEEGRRLGLSENKIEVLGIGIETELFRPLKQKFELRKRLGLGGKKIILFIGRINFAEKGIGYLLEAMPDVISRIPGAVLAILGSGGGESKRLDEMIKNLGIQNSVQLVGKKPFLELVLYLNAADVLVVPSIWMEAFGQVTIEAMACAVPVVTTDAGASPEINLHGQTGLVVEARDAKALAEAVVKILKDESWQQELGMAARRRVLENWTYEVLIMKFLKIIQHAKR